MSAEFARILRPIDSPGAQSQRGAKLLGDQHIACGKGRLRTGGISLEYNRRLAESNLRALKSPQE
jgi:hypothetical protein